jgi:hypothetical protein
MKTKRKLFTCLLAVMLCMTAFSTTAFAGGGEEICEGNTGTAEEAAPPASLTPEGNLTLVDDIQQTNTADSEDAEPENKQFITVQSKAGNYFYLIIDRSGDKENVYFLNLVDEADLMALIEKDDTAEACTCTEKCVVGQINTDCPVCQYNMSECAGKTAVEEPAVEPDTETTPETDPQTTGVNPTVIVLAVLLLAGGVAVYFLKFKKKKPDTKGPVDLDDYDYGEADDPQDDTEQVENIPEMDESAPEDSEE